MITNIEQVGSIVKEVVPYDIPESVHRKLLSILKPSPYTSKENDTSLQETTTAASKLPILNNVDVADIVRANTLRILSERSNKGSKSYEAGDSEAVNPGATVDLSEEPQKYKGIETLIPKNLKDQLDTIVITHFPNVKLIAAEKILEILLGSSRGGYVWSNLNYDYIDNRLLFVKFDRVEDVKWFVTKYEKDVGSLLINESIKIVHHHELSNQDIETTESTDDIDEEDIRVTLNSLLLNVKNYEKVSKKTGTEDLDEVMDYYSRYKVDNSELIDVPSNMREGIVKDIIKFRSEVLNIEREMRKKEIENERKGTKERLKKIYEGIKETNEETVVKSSKDTPEVIARIVEFPELNDKEYDAFLKTEDEESLEKNYILKLAQMQATESIERLQLESTLQKLKSYEQDLINNKERYFKEIQKASEFDPTVEVLNRQKMSHFTSILKFYADDYAGYMSERSEKRLAEELADKEIEKNESELNKDEAAPSVKKIKVEAQVDTEVVDESIDDNVFVIAKLSQEDTEKINEKIKSLVEEYLGEVDDTLVNTISKNITKNNLEAKEDLVKDLSEVLEEDAESLTNDLWEFIEAEFKK